MSRCDWLRHCGSPSRFQFVLSIIIFSFSYVSVSGVNLTALIFYIVSVLSSWGIVFGEYGLLDSERLVCVVLVM